MTVNLSTVQRIKSIAEIARLSEQAKQNGRRVVFTNGIFDFIHAGHLTYLEQAAALGDLFIIGINSDVSTKRLKGPTRPINAEKDRAFILAGLRCVNFVVIFNEDTPEVILEAVKPSVHVKGGDYDPAKMPETPVVERNGGEVKIIPLAAGYSNSAQFEKIQQVHQNVEGEVHIRPDWLAGK